MATVIVTGSRLCRRMLSYFPDALVLAFPRGESKGTWDCIRQAQARGMQVLVLHAPERTALPELEQA